MTSSARLPLNVAIGWPLSKSTMQRIVVVALAPGVFINAKGSTELSGATTTTSFKGPAKHGAFGETIATGQFSARAPSQVFLSHSVVETLGPLDPLAEGRTRFPGPMWAIRALKSPQMQPQHDGTLQDGQVADTTAADSP